MTAAERARELHPRNKGLRGAYRFGAEARFRKERRDPPYSHSGWGRALRRAWIQGYEDANAGRVVSR